MDLACDCQTADGKSYERCGRAASRVSRWGWVNCERHSSVSDAALNSPEGVRRLAVRTDMGLPTPQKATLRGALGRPGREARSCGAWVPWF